MAKIPPRSLRSKCHLIALSLLVSAADAYARAGGGHSSGGSHSSGSHSSGSSHRSSSSSSSHGSSGGGDANGFLVLLFFGVVIFIIWRAIRKAQTMNQNAVIARGSFAANVNLVDPGLRQLRQNDRAFDAAAFAIRVKDGFTKLQHAWCEQSLTSVRPFISDGIQERFSLQFEEQHALGYRPAMENLSILECTPAQVECGAVFDVITMRIGASAKDYRVSAETGEAIRGSEEQAQFTELWSFIRARGSQTKANATGLIEGNCPNCAAPIAMNQGAKCEYCQAVLRSGLYDWVLAEITQQEEWRATAIPPPGTKRILESDPGFSVQDLEDMTSVIFWRKAAADRIGRIDPVRKVASPAWCEMYAAELAKNPPGSVRKIFCDCAVSSVDTLGVILGDTEHRALVEVCWMGRPFEVTPTDELRSLRGEMTVRRSLFVLARNADVRSTPGDSISSTHCPNCGGATMADTSDACEFCHTVLNDGTLRWVLRDIFPSSSNEARDRRARAIVDSPREMAEFRGVGSPASSGGTGALAWMISSVVSNGGVSDDSIRDMLRAAGKKSGLAEAKVDTLIRSAAAGQMEIPQPSNPKQARSWLLEIAIAAHLTGGLSKLEATLITKVGKSHQLTTADVDYVLKCARHEAYKQATSELRAAKRESAQGAGALPSRI